MEWGKYLKLTTWSDLKLKQAFSGLGGLKWRGCKRGDLFWSIFALKYAGKARDSLTFPLCPAHIFPRRVHECNITSIAAARYSERIGDNAYLGALCNFPDTRL